MPSLLFLADSEPTFATLTTSFSFVPTVPAFGGLETFFTTRSGPAALAWAAATGIAASTATRVSRARREARVRFMARTLLNRLAVRKGESAQLRAAPRCFEALDQLVAEAL